MTDNSSSTDTSPHSEGTVSTSTDQDQETTPDSDQPSESSDLEGVTDSSFDAVQAVTNNSQESTVERVVSDSTAASQRRGTKTHSASDSTDSSNSSVSDATRADAHVGTIEPPQRSDTTEKGAVSIPNYAQDLLDFEFVLEAHDDYLPNSVNGEGMIVTGDREFVGIAEVRPRSWSIHTSEKKSEVIQAYKSAFLATLDFPVQIVSYPTTFDISDHVARLKEVTAADRTRPTDSQLVNLGRQLYPNWFDRFIKHNDMKQRQFYIVIPISAAQINQFQNDDGGLLDAAAESFPPLEPVADFFGDSTEADASIQQCLRELDSRLGRVANGLQRLDIPVTRLSDRDTVMSVLYHYYNNEQPTNGAFPTGPYSVESEDAPVTGPVNTE